MEALVMESTQDTPGIIFDKQNNTFEISGKSLPEEVTAFYKPVMDWIDEYLKDPNDETVLQMKFEYFNSASSKVIVEIIKSFVKLKELGKHVEIQWYYPDDDEEMYEAGEEFSDIVNFPFTCINYVVED